MRLAAESLTLGYGSRTVLKGIDLVVEHGEFVVFVGPNGSGKSTLLRGLARLQTPTGGRVMLGEADIRSISSRSVARVLACLPQSPDSGADLTVRELTWRGRYPHQGILQRATATDVDAVAWALEVTDLDSLANRPLGSLSGGERQRAWIAMALAQKPQVLLLDEPTSFLDIQHQVEIMSLLSRLNAEGMTVVAVLHDLALAARYARRVIGIRSGRIEFDGPPSAVITPANLQTVFGIAMSVLVDPETGALVPIPR